MAATYGRLTGKAGVCLATLGPGATNLTTPAAYAALGAFPLVIITGQKPIKVSKQAQFQIVDVVSLFTPLCKMAKQIVNGERIPSLVREGFRRAQEERPGAVLLELPEDIDGEAQNTVIEGIKIRNIDLQRHINYMGNGTYTLQVLHGGMAWLDDGDGDAATTGDDYYEIVGETSFVVTQSVGATLQIGTQK